MTRPKQHVQDSGTVCARSTNEFKSHCPEHIIAVSINSDNGTRIISRVCCWCGLTQVVYDGLVESGHGDFAKYLTPKPVKRPSQLFLPSNSLVKNVNSG